MGNRQTVPLQDKKYLTSAPLNRTEPFPEKGSLFNHYLNLTVYEDQINNLVELTGHAILNALYEVIPSNLDLEDTGLKFYMEDQGQGDTRRLVWSVGLNDDYRVTLGSLSFTQQLLSLKGHFSDTDNSMLRTAQTTSERLYMDRKEIYLKAVNRPALFSIFGDSDLKPLREDQENAKQNLDLIDRFVYDIKLYMGAYRLRARDLIVERIQYLYKDTPFVEVY